MVEKRDTQFVLKHGYNEEGTTTTPFRMLTANGMTSNL